MRPACDEDRPLFNAFVLTLVASLATWLAEQLCDVLSTVLRAHYGQRIDDDADDDEAE